MQRLADTLSGPKNKKTLLALLLLWGVLCACVFVLPYARLSAEEHANITSVYMSSRMDNLDNAMESMAAGQPIRPQGDSVLSHYIYTAAAGLLLQRGGVLPQARYVFLFVQYFFSFVIMAAYPLLLYRWSPKISIALLSPFLLHLFAGRYLYIYKFAVYWASSWIVVAALPLLVLLYKRVWDKKSWVLFGALCLCISIANAFRPHASLGVAVVLVCLLLLKLAIPWVKEKRSRIKPLSISLGSLLMAYFFLYSVLPAIYVWAHGATRDVIAGGAWHALYIGVGWEENPFGIAYNDSVAFDFTQSVNPEVELYSEEYAQILRDGFFDLLKSNPGFLIGSYARKFLQALFVVFTGDQNRLVVLQYLPVLVAGTVLLFLRRGKALRTYAFAWCALLAGGPFTMLEGLIATPEAHYLAGTITSYTLMQMVVVLAAVHLLDNAIEEQRSKRALYRNEALP